MTKAKHLPGFNRSVKKRKLETKAIAEGSNEEVLRIDVQNLLATRQFVSESVDGVNLQDAEEVEPTPKPAFIPPERFSHTEVKIVELSSTGDGLGLSATANHVYVVPFSLPGDVVQAKVVNHFARDHYTLTDFVKVIKPSEMRDESLVRCPYFAACSGCQFQMMPYEAQLAHKKSIVQKAYRHFSGLASELLPEIGETISSPLQYGYRTKLTPHFDGPPGSFGRKDKRNGMERKGFQEVPPIGFMKKGMRKTIDIEDCPIGTDAVREGMKMERKRVAEELAKYKRGATLLLRESTIRKPKRPVQDECKKLEISEATRKAGMDDHQASDDEIFDGVEAKTCITDQNATSTEYVNNFVFSNKAGAFFQNNNSILPKFTAYIRDHIRPLTSDGAPSEIKYLIDAYSGSGLFTVTLASHFSASTGIDISPISIASAEQNAKANNISNATFMAADASELFKKVKFPPEETVVIIDPPRKGCDDNFLNQLLSYGPRRIAYVSCNVHTQARDVGVLVEGQGGYRYEVESVRGFDFFPQTGHVESVAFLNRSLPVSK